MLFSTPVLFTGSSTSLTSLSLHSLIPTTSQFISYEGSLTQPSCQVTVSQSEPSVSSVCKSQESVTWLLPNKPVYITMEHLDLLSTLMQVRKNLSKYFLDNNFFFG